MAQQPDVQSLSLNHLSLGQGLGMSPQSPFCLFNPPRFLESMKAPETTSHKASHSKREQEESSRCLAAVFVGLTQRLEDVHGLVLPRAVKVCEELFGQLAIGMRLIQPV